MLFIFVIKQKCTGCSIVYFLEFTYEYKRKLSLYNINIIN